MKTVITKSEIETIKLAKEIAGKLKGGDLVALEGNLGAGKTVLVKGIARALGIKKTVQSPTFVIMMLYQVPAKAGKKANKLKYLCHIDAYRIKEKDVLAIGAEDYFARPDTLTIIEWAGKIKKILPKKAKWITITAIGKEKRSFKLNF